MTTREAIAPVVGVASEGITTRAVGARLMTDKLVLSVVMHEQAPSRSAFQRTPALPGHGRTDQSDRSSYWWSFEPLRWDIGEDAPRETVLVAPISIGCLRVLAKGIVSLKYEADINVGV